MTTTLVAVLLGAAVAAALWSAGSSAFDHPALVRTNYRGAPLVTAVGVLVPLALVLVAAGAELFVLAAERTPSWLRPVGSSVPAAVPAAVGFALLGLFDDVAGEGQSGGFRGHLRALAAGRLTSGMIKLVGGAALGVVVAQWLARGDEGVLGALRDGAIVALAANLVNLLDRAPGRAVKFSALAFAAAAVKSRSPALAGPAVGIGAGLGLLVPDLRERCMLGDAGSNALGALCGLAGLAALPTSTARWVLVAVLFGLNLLSEVRSFSRIIDAVAPLRWFDRAGSLRPR